MPAIYRRIVCRSSESIALTLLLFLASIFMPVCVSSGEAFQEDSATAKVADKSTTTSGLEEQPMQKAEKKSTVDTKHYDLDAKQYYSHNDVGSFVYAWFAGFDHQKELAYFTKHLDPDNVSMHFPDFPINSIADFKRWYDGVIDSIQWNTHTLSNLTISGDEKSGYTVGLDINWRARTYNGEKYDMNVHQDWFVKVNPKHEFIITKHNASLIQ